MTVATLNNRVSYAGNGATTVFSFPNKFLEDADLVVYKVVDATAVATLQTLTTHYTVSGAGDAGGGNVTMVTAPATGTTLVIYRDPARTQPIDLVNGDPLNVETGVEKAFDRATLQIQRVHDLASRSMRLNDADTTGASTELPIPQADTLIGWNSGGTALQNRALVDLGATTASPFFTTLADDLTGGALVETLRGDLTAETTVADDDEMLFRDTSATAGKRITLRNAMKIITALATETAPAVDDELPLYDASAATADKITLANLLKVVNALTAETAPATDDELLLYDLSAATADKITLADILKVVNALTEDTAPDRAADYVLTYDTSATAAKKVLVRSLSDMVLLAAASFSAASTVDITSKMNSTYNNYLLVVDKLTSSAACSAMLRFSTDNGSTFKAGAADYFTSGGVADTSVPLFSVTANPVTESSIIVNLINMNSTDTDDHFAFVNTFGTTSAVDLIISSAKVRSDANMAAAINALRLLPSAGTITGSYKLYGMRDS